MGHAGSGRAGVFARAQFGRAAQDAARRLPELPLHRANFVEAQGGPRARQRGESQPEHALRPRLLWTLSQRPGAADCRERLFWSAADDPARDAHGRRPRQSRSAISYNLEAGLPAAAHGLAPARGGGAPCHRLPQRRRKGPQVPAVWQGAARDDAHEHVWPDVLLPA